MSRPSKLQKLYKTIEELESAIKYHGSQVELARALEVTAMSISNHKKRLGGQMIKTKPRKYMLDSELEERARELAGRVKAEDRKVNNPWMRTVKI